MSGHSKWATIKHQKGAKDKARGKLFAKVRDASVPTDTIERAIKRGTGELEGVRYEPGTYEGYAPGGVAVFVEALSDNRNRTGAEVRSLFNRLGGSLAEPGAVAWQFERKGVVILPKAPSEDELMLVVLEAGAEDLVDDGDTWRVTSPPAALGAVRAALDAAGVAYDSADVTMQPTSTVALGTTDEAKKVLRLLDGLDEHDDVQTVHANFDIPDDILTTLSV